MEIQHEKPQVKKKSGKGLAKFLSGGLALVLVFWLGVNIGNGRIRVSQSVLTPNASVAGLPEDLDYSSVEQVYDSLKETYDGQLDAETLLDGLKDGLAEASGDEYTEYLNTKEAQEFDDELSGSFTGIGAELAKQNNVIVVVAPLAGFPAEKAGLRAKDVITKIDDESALNLTVNEAVGKIRGPQGTKVTLTVAREGEQELVIEITRQEITIPSVTSEVLEGNIGYMKVSRFGDDTSQLTRQTAESFKSAGVKAVVLDLRGNPGGLLNSAVDLSSLWLPSGKTILQEKRGEEVVQTFRASGSAPLRDVPTVVLIDEGSASASEITAGALKDNGVATLIGQKTFGKGSVQQLEELIGGGLLKVTVARWYTPNGKNIDKAGIEPDQVVERTPDDVSNNRDPQKDAALQFLKK